MSIRILDLHTEPFEKKKKWEVGNKSLKKGK